MGLWAISDVDVNKAETSAICIPLSVAADSSPDSGNHSDDILDSVWLIKGYREWFVAEREDEKVSFVW
jgi:hypothetical protein